MITRNDRTHFYKYTTAAVAKILLKDNTIRWSRPDRFNDPFDMLYSLTFPFSGEQWRRHIVRRLWFIYRGTDVAVRSGRTTIPPLLWQPLGADITSEEFRDELLSKIDDGPVNLQRELNELNNVIRGEIMKSKVLCVSELNDNLLMWAHYSDGHTGAVFRFDNIPALDSPMCAAQRVQYSTEMPRIAPSLSSWSDHILGVCCIDRREVIRSMLYTKSDAWAYEREWRCVGPSRTPDTSYEDIPFHPEEISEIYLGCRMKDENKKEIMELVRARHGPCRIFVANKNQLRFELNFTLI